MTVICFNYVKWILRRCTTYLRCSVRSVRACLTHVREKWFPKKVSNLTVTLAPLKTLNCICKKVFLILPICKTIYGINVLNSFTLHVLLPIPTTLRKQNRLFHEYYSYRFDIYPFLTQGTLLYP